MQKGGGAATKSKSGKRWGKKYEEQANSLIGKKDERTQRSDAASYWNTEDEISRPLRDERITSLAAGQRLSI